MPIKDPEKNRAYRRAYYKRNPEKDKQRNKARRAEIRDWFLNEFKNQLRCECGESRLPCLDFHHNNPDEKEISIGHVFSNGWSKDRIMKEVSKCTVLCSNCHRMLHYEMRAKVTGLCGFESHA